MSEEIDSWSSLVGEVIDEITSIVLGKRQDIELMVATVIAGGHVLIEGPPGIGKTLASKALARTIGGTYRRVQGNPDILPTDLTGFYIHTITGERYFVKGPIFTNILQIDDINRIPPRVHSALLEAMAEYKVSIEGETFNLERPFHVFATMIPPEIESGVYSLALGLIDRFWISIHTGYVERDVERDIVNRSDELYLSDVSSLRTIMSPEKLSVLQDSLGKIVYVDQRITNYIVDIMSTLRNHEDVLAGPSHRGSIYLYRLSKAYALIKGRNYVIPDDVKFLAKYVLPHRILLKPEAAAKKPIEIVDEVLRKVSVPKE
jgi:MoxR-like ATPase